MDYYIVIMVRGELKYSVDELVNEFSNIAFNDIDLNRTYKLCVALCDQKDSVTLIY